MNFDGLMDLGRFFSYGGTVLYLIFGVTVLLWGLLVERLLFYRYTYPKLRDELFIQWQELKEHNSWQAHRVREYFVSRLQGEFGRSLPYIKVLIALCPFFGLLGTVTGMIEVFDVMAALGTTDARAMASGVSKATVPTMAGMFVALVSLLAVSRYENRLKAESQRIEAALTR